MDSTPSVFRCERCGRQASAVFGCPGRVDGICPFKPLTTSRPAWWTVPAAALLALFCRMTQSGWAWASWPWMAAAAGGLAVLLAVTITRVQLYNKATGVVLERTAIGGFQLAFKASVKEGALRFPSEFLRSLHWPLSLLALASAPQPYGDDPELPAWVLRDALIDLIMRRAIELHTVRSTQVSLLNRILSESIDYCLVPTPFGPDETGIGPLESDLMRAISRWLTVRTASASWLDGAPLRQVVEEVVQQDSNPAKQFLNSIIDKAACEGFCERQVGGFGLFFSGPTMAKWSAPPQDQLAAAEALLRYIGETYPGTMDALESLIAAAIRAREVHPQDYSPDVLLL